MHLLGLLLLQEHRARIARPGLLPRDQHADQHGDGLRTISWLTQRFEKLQLRNRKTACLFEESETGSGSPSVFQHSDTTQARPQAVSEQSSAAEPWIFENRCGGRAASAHLLQNGQCQGAQG